MKTFTSVLVFLLLTSSLAFSQDMRAKKTSEVRENGVSYPQNNSILPGPFIRDLVDPIGTVPTLTGYYDYVTNGNCLRNCVVLGDTVIISCVWTDSASAQTSTARKVRYNVSFDGGVTWGTDILTVSNDGNAYPDIVPIVLNGARDIAIAGRQFATGGIRRGYIGVELVLGIGNFSTYLVPPPGSDQFAWKLSGNLIGGAYLCTADSVFFNKFDLSSNTYSGKVNVATPPGEIDINSRQYIAAASNGQNVFVAWWVSTANNTKMVGKESTNGGTSFGSLITVMPYPFICPNGDSVSAWFGADILYKPGTTTKMMALNTLYPGNFGTRRESKLMFWSPAVNGGNPVVIADWTAPTIPLLHDSLTFENFRKNIQVGMTAISHPSLAYTSDNSRLICAYSVTQPDTSSYGYNFNDIYESYSDDNGATWSTPRNLTNTPNVDEIYVSLSKTGNTPTNAGMTFSVSNCPGSTSFTNTTTPICLVYQVYRRYDPVTGNLIPIGVKTISNEVPASFSLQQNYPNPFNPATTIKFAVPKTSEVTLTVFDVAGRVVATLINGEKLSPGTMAVEFSPQNLASGVYFYSLTAGDFKETKKMILLK